jgi:hypothetical protein
MVCLSLHEHPHLLVLSGQQLLHVDRCTWWRWWWIGMRGLPMSTPTACGSLGDVKHNILGGSGSHHLSKVAYIVRYCNSPVVYEASYAEGKYNMRILTIAFTKVTSVSIHHLSSHKIYKRWHMTFVQVAEHNPPTKNKRSTRTLFSHHGLHPRLQAIKLLVCLTYPLKITKG